MTNHKHEKCCEVLDKSRATVQNWYTLAECPNTLGNTLFSSIKDKTFTTN